MKKVSAKRLSRAETDASRIDWESAAALLGIITLGLSQIFYSLVAVRPVAFPPQFPFIFWTLLWIQIFPFLFLFLLEFIFRSRGAGAMKFRIWRCFLYSILALSLLRQFQVFHEEKFVSVFGFLPKIILYVTVLCLIFILTWRFKVIVQSYLAFLGLCGLILPMIFIYH